MYCFHISKIVFRSYDNEIGVKWVNTINEPLLRLDTIWLLRQRNF